MSRPQLWKSPPTHDSIRARMARAVAPGFSYCGRCGMPWARADEHVTEYSVHNGCFPLCEECWQILGHPEARIPYYKALIDGWDENRQGCSPETRRDIMLAVAAGR